MKEQKVNEIVNLYNIPQTAAALCVDEAGVVDQQKLAIAAATMQGVRDGLTEKDRQELETLKAHLKECREQAKLPGANRQALAQRMMLIKDRIFSLGGRP